MRSVLWVGVLCVTAYGQVQSEAERIARPLGHDELRWFAASVAEVTSWGAAHPEGWAAADMGVESAQTLAGSEVWAATGVERARFVDAWARLDVAWDLVRYRFTDDPELYAENLAAMEAGLPSLLASGRLSAAEVRALRRRYATMARLIPLARVIAPETVEVVRARWEEVVAALTQLRRLPSDAEEVERRRWAQRVEAVGWIEGDEVVVATANLGWRAVTVRAGIKLHTHPHGRSESNWEDQLVDWTLPPRSVAFRRYPLEGEGVFLAFVGEVDAYFDLHRPAGHYEHLVAIATLAPGLEGPPPVVRRGAEYRGRWRPSADEVVVALHTAGTWWRFDRPEQGLVLGRWSLAERVERAGPWLAQVGWERPEGALRLREDEDGVVVAPGGAVDVVVDGDAAPRLGVARVYTGVARCVDGRLTSFPETLVEVLVVPAEVTIPQRP